VGDLKAPLRIGDAKADISPYGCRDMFGNGFEWTRHEPGDRSVKLRGQTFKAETPLLFEDEKEPPFAWPYNGSNNDIGFRVVITLEPDK